MDLIGWGISGYDKNKMNPSVGFIKCNHNLFQLNCLPNDGETETHHNNKLFKILLLMFELTSFLCKYFTFPILHYFFIHPILVLFKSFLLINKYYLGLLQIKTILFIPNYQNFKRKWRKIWLLKSQGEQYNNNFWI